MYKLVNDSMVQRLSDGAFIPNDPKNADWNDYQQWVRAGGMAQAADPPPAPRVDKRQAAIDALLAEMAKRPDAPQAVKDYAQEIAK